MTQYLSSLRLWGRFCDQNNFNFFNPTRDIVLSFLSECFENGASYGSLNTHRSTISLIAKDKIGDDPLISRFLKGVFKLRPSKAKYNFTWDVAIVLSFLEKQGCSELLLLKELTEKTVTLLALTTAHRAQTFASIKINNIQISESEITIRVPELIKTSGPGRYQPLLVLPKFNMKPEICVATAIRVYLTRTEKIRGNIQNLFNCKKSSYKEASTQTIISKQYYLKVD